MRRSGSVRRAREQVIGKRHPLAFTWVRMVLWAAVMPITGCVLGPGTDRLPGVDGGERHSYKLYPGLLADHLIVSLDLNEADYATIDGYRVDRADYRRVLLAPGEHRIDWGRSFAFSVMVEPSMWRTAGHDARVTLAPGGHYRLHAARSYGHGYRLYFWIQDVGSGEVVAGEKKP